VTFCKKEFCPVSAEEGLTVALPTGRENGVGCYADHTDQFTKEEMLDLDNEGFFMGYVLLFFGIYARIFYTVFGESRLAKAG